MLSSVPGDMKKLKKQAIPKCIVAVKMFSLVKNFKLSVVDVSHGINVYIFVTSIVGIIGIVLYRSQIPNESKLVIEKNQVVLLGGVSSDVTSFHTMVGCLSNTLEYQRNWRRVWMKNPINLVRTRQARRRYYIKHRDNDPSFVLISRLRARTYKMFRDSGMRKSMRTEKMLLTTRVECRRFLEGFCTYGLRMTHTAGVHVDHVRPICSFDMSDPLDVVECFSYANLQLLPAEVNLSKGTRFDLETHSETIHAWVCAEQRLQAAWQML
jgi:hypothetical protein